MSRYACRSRRFRAKGFLWFSCSVANSCFVKWDPVFVIEEVNGLLYQDEIVTWEPDWNNFMEYDREWVPELSLSQIAHV